MIDFALEITSMVRDSATGVVERVYWRLTGTDADGTTQAAVGSVLLGPAEEGFTPYAALDETEVLAWIAEEEVLASYRQRIADALTRREEPPATLSDAPPWAADKAADEHALLSWATDDEVLIGGEAT